jgi:hypothetical protein
MCIARQVAVRRSSWSVNEYINTSFFLLRVFFSENVPKQKRITTTSKNTKGTNRCTPHHTLRSRVSKTATVEVFKTDKTGLVYRCFRAVYRKGSFSRVGFIEKPVGYPYRAASVRPVTAVTWPVTNGKVNPAPEYTPHHTQPTI